MEYPKCVRIVYADGAEDMGTAIDPLHIDVGIMGLQVRLREKVEIDGVAHIVAGVRKNPEPASDETSVRLRLKLIPGWLTVEEGSKSE
jgi:hypothetical protein